MRTNALIILLSIFILNCEPTDSQVNMIDIEPDLIAKDQLYGAGAEGIVEQKTIITNERAWKILLAQMNSVNNVSDNFSETDIDFSQYLVIAVFSEVLTNGGYSLEFNMTTTPENILFRVHTIGADDIATTVMTQPFLIVKIPISNLPIVFQ
ncbi:protease complex subunit PrcB family protein [Mangrovimonas sp. TPBH4]|uniref:protease complex subunit PrcB family protein n=1 Tax=Mangrovimonas sp. TPBH4 TaxID=1645914 RepID=UPI0006B67003|nr:protease complex subunit PrcB family protein [Mangrovimonas sp. TPBH4]